MLHNNKKHEIKMKKLQSYLKVAIITALKLILYKLKIFNGYCIKLQQNILFIGGIKVRKFLMLLMMLGLICLNVAALAGAPAAENNAANAVQRPFSERLNKAAAEETGAKSQGMKQLMAGGGIIVIGTTLIPLLSGLF